MARNIMSGNYQSPAPTPVTKRAAGRTSGELAKLNEFPQPPHNPPVEHLDKGPKSKSEKSELKSTPK